MRVLYAILKESFISQLYFFRRKVCINSLSSINLEALPRDRVAFGSKVFLEDLNTGEEIVYELVTPEEVDPKNGKVSVSSPVGSALLNKEIGDEVTIQLPVGKKEYSVNRLITLHDMGEG